MRAASPHERTWLPGTLEGLHRRRTALLTTYRRDSTPVETPVMIAVVDDRLVFLTFHSAGKAKRLRRDPSVLAAPSTFRGVTRGEAVSGRARLLAGDPERAARRALAHRSPVLVGLLVPLVFRLAHLRPLYYVVEPA
jgi:PPOX class probable F420-dependent enzyme